MTVGVWDCLWGDCGVVGMTVGHLWDVCGICGTYCGQFVGNCSAVPTGICGMSVGLWGVTVGHLWDDCGTCGHDCGADVFCGKSLWDCGKSFPTIPQ